MKTTIYFFLILLFLSLGTNELSAQAKGPVTTSFWVGGVCGMCEKRIEKALDTKGVIKADYDLDNHTLTLTYNPKKISEDKIHQLLNAVGHDTEKSLASDEEYGNIHGCCKYREHDH
jgi:periplasmic mercuric ion binding protein